MIYSRDKFWNIVYISRYKDDTALFQNPVCINGTGNGGSFGETGHRKFKMAVMREGSLRHHLPFASAGVEKASATVKDSGHVHGARKGTTFSIIYPRIDRAIHSREWFLDYRRIIPPPPRPVRFTHPLSLVRYNEMFTIDPSTLSFRSTEAWVQTRQRYRVAYNVAIIDGWTTNGV